MVPAHGMNAGAFPFPIIASNLVTNGFTSILPTPQGDSCPDALPGADPTLPFVCGDATFFFGSRPTSAPGAFRIFENSASSNYHALQVEGRRRYTGGLQFTAAYTYAHAIDDVSDLFPLAGAPVVAQNSFNLRLERGDANFDVRHRFASSLIWDVPYGRGAKGFVGALLADWQVASIFQAQTGQPFTLNLPYDANLDGNLSDRPPHTDGLIFFRGHGPRRVASRSRPAIRPRTSSLRRLRWAVRGSSFGAEASGATQRAAIASSTWTWRRANVSDSRRVGC